MRASLGAMIAASALVLAAGGAHAAGDADLVDAVRKQDAAAVRALLKQGANPNSALADGATAMHWAAYRDSVDIADLLIRARARLDVTNDLGVTPLSLACANGSAGMVERLLAAGANPNVALPTGETPLMTCARTGNVAAVKALLARRADVNARDAAHGQTALMWAAAARHPEVVQLLVELGARVDARSSVTEELVYTGMRYITSPPPDSSGTVVKMSQGGFTPLLFAAQQGDVASARVLVAAGANVNDVAPVGTSALVVAAHSGHGNVAAWLLEQGADPNAAGAGYTALHAAVLKSDLPLVQALLARGADPNARLEKGTPVRKYSQDYALSASWIGATPLWLAARFAEIPIARTLVAAGADPQAAIQDGTTPLLAAIVPPPSMAAARDRRERYLYPAEAALLSPDSSERETFETVKMLMAVGSAPTAVNQAGNTAIHLAAQAGYHSLIKTLAEAGVDLNARNKRGLTPLGTVTGAGRVPAAASVNAGTMGGDAAIAAQRLKGTAELLRSLGATE